VSDGWVDAVRQVVAAVRASDVTHLELAGTDFSVRVRREPSMSRTAVVQLDEDAANLHRVLAPFTGVFYRSPTPSARPYVNVGDWVDVDAVIGLVETMKIFSSVTADISGHLVAFKAENEALVQAGDVLALIEPGERTAAESEPHV
jgi:acetyl-CoA carboxylase biotin carboxyl carrier protein